MRLHTNARQDDGSALVVVLIMVVILTLWFSAVSMLTQSASSAITNNGKLAESRSSQMNGAFVDALRQLSPLEGSDVTRIGTDLSPIKCSPGDRPVEPFTADDGSVITIDCMQIDRSGLNSAALASFILTGTSGTTGSGAGLYLKGQGTDCVTGTFTSSEVQNSARLAVQGGVINVSGIWAGVSGNIEGVECKRFALQQEAGQIPPVIKTPPQTCPTSWYRYSIASTGTTPTWTGKPFYAADGASGGCIESTDLTDSAGELQSYLSYVVSTLEGVTGNARFVGVENPTWCDAAANGTNRFLEVSPGTIDGTFIGKLTNLTSSTGCAGQSATGYVLIFRPGVYRFTANTETLWTIKSGNVSVVGGAPKWAALNTTSRNDVCDNTTAGVQFQFAGQAKMLVQTGRLSLCGGPNSTKPVFVALSPELATAAGLSFPWTGTGDVLTTGLGSNNGDCAMCVNFEGLYFGPAASANISINGSSGASFKGGAVSKALSMYVGANVKSSTPVLPPPPSIGDRVVQLKFTSSTLGYLGTVQVVIKDYFGRRVASGYRILSWRASW